MTRWQIARAMLGAVLQGEAGEVESDGFAHRRTVSVSILRIVHLKSHGRRSDASSPAPSTPSPPPSMLAALDAGIAASGALVSHGQPAWQHDLSVALKRSSRSPAAKYLQLATVTPAGLPAVRTVVFRGWLWNTCTLMMITDARSSKLQDIAAQKRCEIAWYLEKTREQFRIKGDVRAVYPDEQNQKLCRARETVWRGLSDSARAQFDDATPGVPIGDLPAQAGEGEAVGTSGAEAAVSPEAPIPAGAADEPEATDGSVAPDSAPDAAPLAFPISAGAPDGSSTIPEGAPDGSASPDAALSVPFASPNFVLLLLRPDGVDQLRLSRPQRRWMHTLPAGAKGLEPPGETAAADDAESAAAWRVTEVTP